MGTQPKLDEWIYGSDKNSVLERMSFYLAVYASSVSNQRADFKTIKWHRELVKKLNAHVVIPFDKTHLRRLLWRPYAVRYYYDEPRLVSMNFLQPSFWMDENFAYSLSGPGAGKPFAALATDLIPNHDLLEKAQVAPRYRYTKSGERIDNITDWALKQFQARYGKKAGVTKDAIFAYCYAVLHDPHYREKYALNLKREFPRIPFYNDFARWRDWGQQLLDLHIGYGQAKPFGFTRIDTPTPKRVKGSHPKPKLKSDPEQGLVIVDEDTQLTGIPTEAWDYRLGNRSAIDWVLDQHKEKTPRDPTIRAKFNTYRFAAHKEEMIKLLAKAITVSLETVRITEAMRATVNKETE